METSGISRSTPSRKRKLLVRGGVATLSVVLTGVGLALAVRQSHIRHQRQDDPQVATVWLMQATRGPNHTLTRGSTVQRWANQHNIHFLGDYQVLTSNFNGEPNGIEFWFDYQSHVSTKELECHRIGPAAFVDDLGQVYHGFLDFQGRYVGVYLPGYDHAAHRITCTVRWMPRRPAAPVPVSHPMSFTVPLTPVRRQLPAAAMLPADPVRVTRKGITVTLSEAHLGPTKLRGYYDGQRDLLFRLQIQGGQISDENLVLPTNDTNGLTTSFSGNAVIVQGQIRSARGPVYTARNRAGSTVFILGNGSSDADSFRITDPYGISLVPDTASITLPATKPQKGQKASPYWVAPVTGTGRGTDCVQLHFHVQPPASSSMALPPEPVAFDIPLRLSPATAL